VSLEVMRQDSRSDRKVYSITAMGTAALPDWIMERSPLPAIEDELLIKLFADHTLPTEAIRTLIQDPLETVKTS
jgi:DNA-binding PadR family transcriptional regulator